MTIDHLFKNNIYRQDMHNKKINNSNKIYQNFFQLFVNIF